VLCMLLCAHVSRFSSRSCNHALWQCFLGLCIHRNHCNSSYWWRGVLCCLACTFSLLFSHVFIFTILTSASPCTLVQKTRSFVMNIIAQLVGIGVTLGIKQIVLLLLRKQFLAAFYRKMPLKDNFMNVMLECWNIGLSSGIMLMRTAKLLLVTAFFLGRLDTPLLADGVGFIGPIALDSYPISFRKDLLQHDAHRHPYIERLATMYMMKLRYGNDFGHRANACWRLLFVLCLMPWMRKYRLRAFPSLEGLDLEIEEAEAELAIEEDEIAAGDGVAPDRALRRRATKCRLENMQNLRSLHIIGTTASREEILEREVTVLRERNRQLLAQVKQLGGNPASSRRNLMAYQDQSMVMGTFPDRRGANGNSSQLSLVSEESEEAEEDDVPIQKDGSSKDSEDDAPVQEDGKSKEE